MNKNFYFVLLVILLSSCTISQPAQRLDVATANAQPLSTIEPSPIPSIPTTATTLIPKHGDLIFVEFFAVT
jgi:hypothetical protein